MSPDELLVLVPYGEAQATVAALEQALAGTHHLVADVSDARAVFTIRGARADEVLRKLCPVDFDALAEGEIRRTRAAQVAAAFWKSGPEEFTLVSFRSVAAYVMGLLEVSVRPGSELFPA
jgi:sarcosine oxidase subunit gamma